jgi:hypothetical protein
VVSKQEIYRLIALWRRWSWRCVSLATSWLQTRTPVTQTLLATADYFWRELEDLLPCLSNIHATADVETLLVNADERDLVAGDNLAEGHGGELFALRSVIGARSRGSAGEPAFLANLV